jgi:hypothetical protein
MCGVGSIRMLSPDHSSQVAETHFSTEQTVDIQLPFTLLLLLLFGFHHLLFRAVS